MKWLVVRVARLPVVLLLVVIVAEALGVLPPGVAQAIGRLLLEALAELPDGMSDVGRPFVSNWFSPEQIPSPGPK